MMGEKGDEEPVTRRECAGVHSTIGKQLTKQEKDLGKSLALMEGRLMTRIDGNLLAVSTNQVGVSSRLDDIKLAQAVTNGNTAQNTKFRVELQAYLKLGAFLMAVYGATVLALILR